ncbi:MAG: membrane protein insertion efficiency factor YidD [Gammaproteobacteria bacterium]|nr:membrane protein insertion efficiency factor YidD [Gammaproteobacteria bacterium]
MAFGRNSTRQILVQVIRAYQYLLSSFLGQRCRFYPSCSQYAIEAINLHGLVKGAWFSTKRLLRCHPWHQGGVDLVPQPCNSSNQREK